MALSKRILVVDDDASLARLLVSLFESSGFEATGVGTIKEAVSAVGREPFDVALIDLNLPDGTGLDLLAQLRGLRPEMASVMLTAAGSIEIAVEAMRRGADNFVSKPIDPPALVAVIERGVDAAHLRRRTLQLDRLIQSTQSRLLGESLSIKQVLGLAERVAVHDTTVLITGATGTGKGLLARTIHDLSPRHKKNFVALNSAGISREIVESELFGHERGAFTGAVERKLGLFEAADGGTLFLDEIGELDLSVQAKLLTAIEERRFRRVGGVVELTADVRLLAATHRNLKQLVDVGKFRADLYHRLNVFTIDLPALSERDEDVLPLAVHFLRSYRPISDPARALTDEAAAMLLDYDWPGNVRELRNVMERAAILAPPDGPIGIQHLPPLLEQSKATAAPLEAEAAIKLSTLEAAERAFLEKALRERKGSLRAAARDLGISRGTLYRKARKFGIPLDSADER
jgi:DNA-binding NtrC family response regulator